MDRIVLSVESVVQPAARIYVCKCGMHACICLFECVHA